MMYRRDLLRLAAGSGATLLLNGAFPVSLRAQDATINTQDINATTALLSGAGCNVLAKKSTSGELLIVDGGLATHAGTLRNAIESALDSRRVHTLVNTHWHPEHVGLNDTYGNGDVRIFAHENTRQWLSTTIAYPWDNSQFQPAPENARPNDTFHHYGDFSIGDTAVEYGYLRQAHTDGDMYVFLPQDNVLHTGGLINSDSWPLMDWWTGGWIGGLVDGLETLLSIANDNTLIIPARGPVMTVQQLRSMRDLYAEIFSGVSRMFQSAYSVEETLAENPAAAYESQLGDSRQFVELSWWSLIPHYTPDA